MAAHLIVQGAEGEATSELAGLPRTASPWAVDHLVPSLLAELAIPELSAQQVGDLVARVFGYVAAIRAGTDEFAAVRALARLAPDNDYPDGDIGDAYSASEWLDCECHVNSPERDAATAMESTLRGSEPLVIDPGLLWALSTTWFRR
ncbi:hypothetical protein [Actinoplanes sp. NPDC051494]|uniref:hypothetical protein n=1 Tax=Actinoplanes sp. NPDC051494 TaxID=3363907 RepID=UPI00378BE70E